MGRRHKTYRYSLLCKSEEVYSIPIVSYHNEEMMVPFPQRRTLIDPRDEPNEFDIDCFCDLLFYDIESLEYSLLFHIRRGEALRSPLESHIKPGIVRLPFLFLTGDDEVEEFAQVVQQKIAEFPIYKKKKEKDRKVSGSREEQHRSERLFSEWVLEISRNL